jgi:phosphocarrier protein NPr
MSNGKVGSIEKTMTIVNKLGLHARAATQLVQLANQFDAKIVLKKEDKEADANSVLGLMMLESHQGEQVDVIVDGNDAVDALAAIEELIEGRFNEDE